MIKPERLKRGDKVAIVSLSSGMLGEEFTQHNLKIGKERLEELGLEVEFMPNSLKGIDYLKEHPEKRAEDLIEAFSDDSIKGIICAIGGDDTYKTLPYLMEDEYFRNILPSTPKIFTGFSDSTVNHLMFYKLGLTTYYGMSFITDIGEISHTMLPYTERYFRCFLDDTAEYQKIEPSKVWYDERLDFSKNAIGDDRVMHIDHKGYELLQGKPVFRGELLGGCLDSLYDMLMPNRYEDEPMVVYKYGIFPKLEEWRGKILFIETSEEKVSPEIFEKMISQLKVYGIFEVISGMIVGKPQDEVFYEEYKQVLIKVIDDASLPILYNVNFGHATPRCVLPYGVQVEVDSLNQEIRFLESPFMDEEETVITEPVVLSIE